MSSEVSGVNVSADSVFICIKITYWVRVRRPRQATAPTYSKNAAPLDQPPLPRKNPRSAPAVQQLQILRAETKNKGSRTNMGQEDSTALTGIAHLISISTFSQLLGCARHHFESCSPPYLSHSLRIVVFLSVLLWRHCQLR